MSRIKSLIQEGNTLFESTSYEEALEVFHTAQKLSPLSTEVAWGVIKCQIKLREFQQALETFEQALKRAVSKSKHNDFKRDMAALLFQELSYANAYEVFSSIAPAQYTKEDLYLSIKYQLFITRTPDLDAFLMKSLKKDFRVLDKLLEDDSISEARKEQLREKEEELRASIEVEWKKDQEEREAAEKEAAAQKEAKKAAYLEKQAAINGFFKAEKDVLYKTMLYAFLTGGAASIFYMVFNLFELGFDTSLPYLIIGIFWNFAFGAALGFVVKDKDAMIKTGAAYAGVTFLIRIVFFFIDDNYYLVSQTIASIVGGAVLGYISILSVTKHEKAATWAALGGILGNMLGDTAYNGGTIFYDIAGGYGTVSSLIFGFIGSFISGYVTWGCILLFRTLAYQESHKQILRNILSFKGKIGRMRFFLRRLVIFGLMITVYLAIGSSARMIDYYDDSVLNSLALGFNMIVYIGLVLFFMIINIAQAIKRLRDGGQSPYMYFLGFVPILSLYLFYLLYFKETEHTYQRKPY